MFLYGLEHNAGGAFDALGLEAGMGNRWKYGTTLLFQGYLSVLYEGGVLAQWQAVGSYYLLQRDYINMPLMVDTTCDLVLTEIFERAFGVIELRK